MWKAFEARTTGERQQAVSDGRNPSPFLSILACLTLSLLTVAAQAQTPSAPALPASLEQSESEKNAERAELQRELRRHAGVLETQSAVVKIVAKLVGPAVVHIEADVPPDENQAYYNNGRRAEESGSGVIVETKGNYYVLTNRHVVKNAAKEAIKINLPDGRRIHPTRVLEDAATDVAVMTVSAPSLVAVPIGDSDRLDIGDFVLAVGSPFGLSQSVTFGIVSAKGRRDLRIGEAKQVRFQDFLQTDAAINPGNSGGPLINLRGEVVGINTAIASNSGGNEGIGFAIPINMFMTVGRQLIEHGEVTRAFLGVNMNSNFGPAMAQELGLPRLMGAHVSGVVPNSPAEIAKLQTGDVILEFNGAPVEDTFHLSNMVSLTEVGKTVPLLIFRDRKPLKISVQVGASGKFAK